MKDMENIERLRSGSMDALGRIYEIHHDGFVKSLCKAFGCSEEEASDLFNEVLIKLYYHVMEGGFQEERDGGLGGWLFVVGRNMYLQMLKEKQKLPVIANYDGTNTLEISDDDSDAYDPEIDLRDEAALEALKRMPEACRRLLTMYYLDDKSLIEIAKTLNRSYKAVKKDRWRCLQDLKKMIF